MVGHYWLRNPALAPTPEIRQEIERTFAKIKEFRGQNSFRCHHGRGGAIQEFSAHRHRRFRARPAICGQALGNPRKDKLKPFFFDNTDPDGMNRTWPPSEINWIRHSAL